MGENMSKADFLARNELFRLIGRLFFNLVTASNFINMP